MKQRERERQNSVTKKERDIKRKSKKHNSERDVQV